MLVANGPERIAREERVKTSIEELVQDPLGQKSMLRLEPRPRVSDDLDKGKGIVFNFDQRKVKKEQ